VKRILIEFYDPSYLENIFALFGARYDAVKFLYLRNANAPSSSTRKRLAYFIWQKFGIRAEFISLPMDNMETLLSCFQSITSDEGRYDFDVTGGTPVFVAASGIFLAKNKEKDIFLVEYEVKEGELIYCYPECNCRAEDSRPRIEVPLTVSEIITLSGTSFLSANGPRRFDSDEEVLRFEVDRLWKAVRHSMRGWNAFCALAQPKNLPAGRKGKIYETKKVHTYETVAQKLHSAGIISDEKTLISGSVTTTEYTLHVTPKADFLYEKGGNLLEMVSYFAAKSSGAFCDVCVGVELDWDGQRGHGNHEPCNELDLVFTYGHIPVFVSCKGTIVEKEYLYEIATMAKHFGGQYARAALISTVKNRRSIHNRAREMGILLIDDVSSIGIEGLAEKLRKYFPKK